MNKISFRILLFILFSYPYIDCKIILKYQYDLWDDTKPLGNLPPKYFNTIVHNTKTSVQIPVHQYTVSNEKSNLTKALIISFAINYNIYDLLMFVTSMRRYYDDDALLFVSETNNSQFYQFLSHYKIDYVNLTNEYPYYSLNNSKYPINESEIHIPRKQIVLNKWAVIRLFITNKWLKIYGGNYSHFLLCDSRDIIYQGNPFNWNIGNGLYFTENTRGYRIKDSNWNIYHFLNFKYGYKYIDNIILCGGVIYSNYEGIIWWYNKVSEFMENNVIVSDQNNFNYIFYHLNQNEIDNHHIYILCNEYGPARNLASDVLVDEERSKPKEDNMIYNLDGSIPYVIHQFDRNGILYKDFVKKHSTNYIHYVDGYFSFYERDLEKILKKV